MTDCHVKFLRSQRHNFGPQPQPSGLDLKAKFLASSESRLIDRVKVLRATRHKIGHFGDVLPSQSLGLVLKKTKTNTRKANMHP